MVETNRGRTEEGEEIKKFSLASCVEGVRTFALLKVEYDIEAIDQHVFVDYIDHLLRGDVWRVWIVSHARAPCLFDFLGQHKLSFWESLFISSKW